ncbi:unnamed protein product [Alopecurus aequalis]
MATSWADLPRDLLVSIADGQSLRAYTRLRGVCAGWRSALVPPYPCLLFLDDSRRCSIFSLSTQRSFHLNRILYASVEGCGSVVGSGNGRLAVVVNSNGLMVKIFLLDPRGREAAKILCAPPAPKPSVYYWSVRKVVFAPDPDDGTVVAMCDCNRVAYTDTCRGRDMLWKTVNIIAGDEDCYLADLAFDAAPGGNGKVYCLDSAGGARVLSIPRRTQDEPSVGAAFPRPYGLASELNFTKYLFFCHDDLYQLWQNNSATADEIFVLRHDPADRQGPCWDVVRDLGGCSVFVGKNSSPAVVRAGAIPGVRGDCVYWIDRQGNSMVCDVATGSSKPLVLPYGACKVSCWYFGDDNMTSNNKRGH